VIACLAHNLLRWTEVMGLGRRTVRFRADAASPGYSRCSAG
jgi:hypothetical protein